MNRSAPAIAADASGILPSDDLWAAIELNYPVSPGG